MSSIDPILTQFALCHGAIRRNLEGLSHEESIIRPGNGGNSANWVIGHILTSRSGLLKRFAGQPLLDDDAAKSYARGSKGDLERPLPLDELLATLYRSQLVLVGRLKKLG